VSTLTELERSTEGARPLELFEFIISGVESFRYVSREVAPAGIEVDGLTWLPRPITRDRIQRSAEISRQTLEVQLVATDALAQIFQAVIPAARVQFTLYRYEPDAVPALRRTLFVGYVTTARFNQEVCSFEIAPFNQLFRRQIPRMTYSGVCNHVLYDTRCKVDSTAAINRLTATVSAVNGNVVTIPGAGSMTDPTSSTPALGGWVSLTDLTDHRTIIAQDGDDLTLHPFGFRTSILGTEVFVQRGCDHLPTTCRDKHNNIPNIGAHPYVPSTNPFNQATLIPPP
jgi:hypothetical protein